MTEQGYLDTGEGHRVFWKTSGALDGAPCLVIHGGPGAGSSEGVVDLFDLARVRLIQFDQRGCGRSMPRGSVEANTTMHLLADIERLREHLAIESWHVFAGSWGTTLGLLHAGSHPDRCLGLILRGVTEWTPDKYEWALDSRRFMAPAAHEYLLGILSGQERRDVLRAYHSRIMAGEREAAKRWHLYEKWFSNPDALARIDDEARLAPDFEIRARIHVHYWMSNAFLASGQMEAAISALSHIPVAIVHGALDFVCPPLFAHRLADRMPYAHLALVPGAGHAASDPAIAAALRAVLARAKLA
jgi:proline iminopeptidase